LYIKGTSNNNNKKVKVDTTMMEDSNVQELDFLEKTSYFSKKNFIRALKFLIIPGWRDSGFSQKEYEIDKIKSKRKFFRRLIKPLTLLVIGLIMFIIFLGAFLLFYFQERK